MRGLLNHEHLSGTPIMFVPECNLEHAALLAWEVMVGLSPLIEVPYISKERCPGVHNTDGTKREGGDALVDIFRVGNIRIIKNFVTANPWKRGSMRDRRRDEFLKLIKQLGNLRKIYLDPKSAFGQSRYTYSGKCGGDNLPMRGQNDDVAIGLLSSKYVIKRLDARMIQTQYSLRCE